MPRPRKYSSDRPSTPAERVAEHRARISLRLDVTIRRLKRGIWPYELGDDPGENDRFFEWCQWWLYRPGGKPEGREWGPLRFAPIFYTRTGMKPGEEPVFAVVDDSPALRYPLELHLDTQPTSEPWKLKPIEPQERLSPYWYSDFHPATVTSTPVALPRTEPEDEPLFALPPAFLNLTARITSPAVGRNGMSRAGEVSRPRLNWCPECRGYKHRNHEHRTVPEVIRIELKVPVKVRSNIVL